MTLEELEKVVNDLRADMADVDERIINIEADLVWMDTDLTALKEVK
jgi:hypothetical protein